MSAFALRFPFASSRSSRTLTAPTFIIAGLLGACSAGPEASPDPFETFEPGGAGSGGSPSAGGTGGTAGDLGGAAGGASGSGGFTSAGGSEGTPPIGGLAGQGGSVASAAGAGGATSGGAGGATGGAPAAGGTGGITAGGAGGTTAAASCSSGAIVCDDFESESVGQFPDGPAWDDNACTSHVIDDSVAHTGQRSLRGGAEQYPACMAHANIATESEVYARSWIRLGAPSGESGHEIGFLEFGPLLADNPEVRVGVRNNDSVCAQAPGVEVTADGVAGGERTSCSGVALDADRWYCLEVHFRRAPGSISFGVQIDGASVVPETTLDNAVATWTDGPLFMKLGRSSYGGNNVFPVWHDDVVVSAAPVGCAD